MGPQVAPLGPLLLARGRPPGVCCWYFFVTFLFILIFLTKHICLYRKSLSGLVVSRLLPAEFDQTCVFLSVGDFSIPGRFSVYLFEKKINELLVRVVNTFIVPMFLRFVPMVNCSHVSFLWGPWDPWGLWGPWGPRGP